MQNDENSFFEFALFSTIGDRGEQQDSSGFELKMEEGLLVLCDGMGGHEGGKQASSLAVGELLKAYQYNYPSEKIEHILKEAVVEADTKISNFVRESGERMMAGTTLVAAHIKERALCWLSVGDSRIYLQREDELEQITVDHNYELLLAEKRMAGEITPAQYESEMERGEALISFLGIGGIPRMDISQPALQLRSKDKILLTTDGLYKLLSSEEINRIIANFTNIEEAVQALELKARRIAKEKGISRDNMTVALIKMK